MAVTFFQNTIMFNINRFIITTTLDYKILLQQRNRCQVGNLECENPEGWGNYLEALMCGQSAWSSSVCYSDIFVLYHHKLRCRLASCHWAAQWTANLMWAMSTFIIHVPRHPSIIIMLMNITIGPTLAVTVAMETPDTRGLSQWH